MSHDALGDRMKEYEGREAQRRFLPQLPICVRIDGKRFSRWTKGLARPFDPRLSETMIATTERLVEETGAVVGYTQSDEISLVLFSADPKSQTYLDGRVQKLCSILASLTTATFNQECRQAMPERAERPALFDCRAWTVPTRHEAANALLWRERDATKNSLSMAAREHYSHRELHGKGSDVLHELLYQAGVNFNDYPAFFKRGTFVQRRSVSTPFTPEQLEALPPKHQARTTPDLVVTRTEIRRLDMPPFNRVLNRVEVVFEGADPVTESAPG
ncbi:MAG: tRNA(His) guanylyltransferase Thg1 family protein [Myxococcales bacterium]|nr:tRNA(His) guanylyltransferase Thg1 family protein [Myxococcales bacterium]